MKSKRIISLILSLLMVLSLMPTNISFAAINASDFAGGSGTQADPYRIETLAQLEAFRDSVNDNNPYSGKYVKLMADIDMSNNYSSTLSASWEPIGNQYYNFEGTFDGNGHKITGLYVYSSNTYLGLFGYVRGTVKNLSVSGSVTGKYFIGGIAGALIGTVENCYSDVELSFYDMSGEAGGIASLATAKSIIRNCYYTGKIIPYDKSGFIGGIAGWSYEGARIENNYSIGEVGNATSMYSGGIVGYDDGAAMTNNYYKYGTAVRGVGQSTKSGTAEVITAEDMGKQEKYVGWDFENVWVMDEDEGRPFLRSCSEKAGTEKYPYLISDIYELKLFRAAVNNGDDYKDKYVKLTNYIDMSSEYNAEKGSWIPIGTSSHPFNGTFDGGGNAIKVYYNAFETYGGLFGYTGSRAVIENLGVSGEVTVIGTCAGGIVGDNGGAIRKCYNTAKVTNNLSGSNSAYAGGIAGYMEITGRIENCYNTGAVVGDTYVGAIVGHSDGADVYNCYNIVRAVGSMSSDIDIYGTCTTGTKIKYCYTTVGYNVGSENENEYIIRITTEGLANQDTFSSFDFENVWVMDTERPLLRGCLEPTGSVLSPQYIYNLDEFKAFRNAVNGGNSYNGKHVKLMADIDLGGSESNQWTPIGSEDNKFKGTFDGNGHEIKNLYIDSQDRIKCKGLFGIISEATIKNLTVDGSVKGKNMSDSGGIVARSFDSTIENCCNKASVITEYDTTSYIGGIAGEIHGTKIKNCYNTGKISGCGYSIGGIVGSVYEESAVENCYNTGEISTTYDGAGGSGIGGVVGYSDASSVTNCYNVGTVTAPSTATEVGGAVGGTDITRSVKSVYYLDACAGAGTSFDSILGTAKSADSFTGGEVAYILQKAQSDQTTQVWGQKLTGESTDSSPVLTSDADKKVYKVSFMQKDSGSESGYKEFADAYANKGGAVAKYPTDKPADNDYSFVKWSVTEGADGDEFTAATKVYDDMSVYAVGKELTAASSKDDTVSLRKGMFIAVPIELKKFVANKSGKESDNFVFALSEDSELPAGITLNEAGGTLEGKPTCNAGVYTVKFDVANNNGIALMSVDTAASTGVETLTLKLDIDLEQGSGVNTYLINNLDELKYFRDSVNNGRTYSSSDTVKLNANIDLGGSANPWTPIGKDWQTCFIGTFDGAGHKVTDMYIHVSDGGNAGFFGAKSYGTVKNLGVEGDVICTNGNNIGGIVGWNIDSDIINCYHNGKVEGSSTSNVGGIVGFITSSGTINRCYNVGDVTGGVARHQICDMSDNTYFGSGSNNYYLASTDDGNGGKTAEQFKNGEVAWLLQNGQSEQVWGLRRVNTDVPKDDYPVLTSDESLRIYKLSFLKNNEGEGDYTVYDGKDKYLNKGDSLIEFPSISSELHIGWSESAGGEKLSLPYTFEKTEDTSLFSVWKGKVTFDIEGKNHIYAADTVRQITLTPKVNGAATDKLSADDFIVTYYTVDENYGGVDVSKGFRKPVSIGKYFYVINFAEDELKNDYYIDRFYDINYIGTEEDEPGVVSADRYDNIGYMYIASGAENAQKPIYFEKQTVDVTMKDTVENRLVNQNVNVDRVEYTSSNPTVAEVDAATGAVTIKGAGSTVIMATSYKSGASEVYASYTLNVTKKVITVTAKDKTISYGDAFANDGYTLSETVELDDTNVSYATDYHTGDGIGKYEIRVSGLESDVYEIEYKSGRLTVEAKAISLSDDIDVSVAPKSYDESDVAAVNASVKASSLVDGDKVTVLASGTYDTASAGEKTVSYEIDGLSGRDSSNYALTGTLTGTIGATINQAEVTLSAPATTTHVYDTYEKSVSVLAYANGIYFGEVQIAYYKEGEATPISGLPVDVGVYDVKATITNSNYKLKNELNAKLTIKSAQQDFFSIEGIGDTVTYGDVLELETAGTDGNVSYSIKSGGAYATLTTSTDPDSGKPVTKLTATGVGTVTLEAVSQKTNYADKTATRTFVIRPKTIGVSAVMPTSRTYNGLTDIEGVTLTATDVIGSDTVGISMSSATVETPDVENNKTVFVNGLRITSVNGSSDENELSKYQLSSTAVQSKINITKAPITAVAISAVSKDYDGTTAAEYTVGELTGVISGEEDFVSVTGTANFNSKNVTEATTVTLSGMALTGAKSGNYTLTATSATGAASIRQANVSFGLGTLSYVYDGNPKSVSVSATVNGRAFDGYTVSYGGNATDVGEHDVIISLNDRDNYKTDYTTEKLKIVKADQSAMTITGLVGTLEHGRSFKLTAVGGASSINTQWTSSDTDMATVDSDGNVTIGNVTGNTVTITATKPANNNFAAQSASVTFTPVKKSVSITVRNLNQTYDGSEKPVEVTTAATTKTVQYFDEEGMPLSGVPKAAGTYYVQVTATGNYEGEQSAVLTIKKATLDASSVTLGIIDENGDSNIVYGESYSIIDSYEGDVADKTLTFTGTGIYGETDVQPKNAGSYTAIVTISKDNFESKSWTMPFSIKKATLTAKPDNASRAYGANNPEFTVKLTGFKHGDTESSVLIKPTASTTAHSSSPVDTYPIVATGGYADNYEFAYENGTLTVTKATGGNFYIVGGNASPYVDNEFTLTAYYNNDVPNVRWESDTPAVATVGADTGKVKIVGVGEATITAYMTDSRFDNSLTVTFKLKASRLPETQNLIVFTEPIMEKYVKDDDFTVTVSNASQGATVKYTSSNPSVAAVDENTGRVEIKKNGTVVITATAVKDNCPDVSASYTLTVKKIPLTITADNKTLTYGDTFTGTTVEYSVAGCTADEFSGTLDFATKYTNTSRVDYYDVTPKGLKSDIYDITFASGTITVEPRPLTAADFVVEVAPEKTYDGTTEVGISASVAAERVVGTDNLFVNITGAFTDANADAEPKEVKAKIESISGKGFENYVLSGSMEITKSSIINPCEVKFFASAETVKNYDGQVHRIDISAMANGNVYGSENYTVWYKGADEQKIKEPTNVGEYSVLVELDSSQTNYTIKTQPTAVLKIERNTNVELTIQGSYKNVTVGDKPTLCAWYGNEAASVTWSSSKPDCVYIDADTGEVNVLKATDETVTITATMKNPNFFGLSKNFDMIVSKKEIKLSAADSLVREYNGEAQSVTYKCGTLDLSDVTVNTTYTLIGDSSVTEPKNVGTYYVAYEIDDERYTGDGSMMLYINKATVKVHANTISKEYGKQYGKEDYELAVSDNVKGIDADALYDYVAFSSEGAASTADVGEYPISVTLTKENDANCDYVVDTDANGKLTVTPAKLTVRVDDVTREWGEANPTELVYTIEGFKNDDNAEALTGAIVPKYADTITDNVGTQKDVITAESTLANGNYTIDIVYNDGDGADLIINKIAVGVGAGVSRTTYLTITLDKPLANLTASNFEVKNGETPVAVTEAVASSDNKTYTLKGTFATTVTYTVMMTITSDTHELAGLPLSIKPSGSGSSGGSGGSGGGGGGGSAAPTTYIVAFDTNGGSEISSVKVEKNGTAAEPNVPEREGYIFGGWYTDKALTVPYDFDSKVTKATTLYAKWIEDEAEKPDEGDNGNDDNNKPTPSEWRNPFVDVNEDDWFYAGVKYANENGLMSGTSETEFAPDETLTRGMLVTVLYRAAGEPDVNGGAIFDDVSADSYYASAVSWAQQNGIVMGVSENEFESEESITREQIAAIMFRYAKHMQYDVSVGESTNILSYTDYDEISEYAVEAMQYAVGSGLMKGKTESTLNPKDTATRAEIAVILNRFIEGNK